MKKSEGELKTQLATSMAEAVKNASEWANAKQLYEGVVWLERERGMVELGGGVYGAR